MRSTGLLRLGLIVCLGLTAAGTTGCENENDPATWVGKLGTTNKRPAAMRRLRQMWESKLATTTPPNNLRDPGIRVAFLNAAIPTVNEPLSTTATRSPPARRPSRSSRRQRDPRAIPALLNALEFSPGNSESERIALRAAQALKRDAPREQRPGHPAAPGHHRPRLGQQRLRPGHPRGGHPGPRRHRRPQRRPVLVRTLKKPIDQQEIRTARAAADALGVIGDAVPAAARRWSTRSSTGSTSTCAGPTPSTTAPAPSPASAPTPRCRASSPRCRIRTPMVTLLITRTRRARA
jgi:hypothetical protein